MKMRNFFLQLLQELGKPYLSDCDVIPWACPVPYFGDLSTARMATIGINPSNREFVDADEKELTALARRFPTLLSLGLAAWSEATEVHAQKVEEACKEYFFRNPYDGWFKRLDYLISGANSSYYFPLGNACHLDLVPYATATKWSALTSHQKNTLFKRSADFTSALLRNSSIELLVLNGRTVIQLFQLMANVTLTEAPVESWSLLRKTTDDVLGCSYSGTIDSFGGIRLHREIRVLGYNHNIQSSFGVTSHVQDEIRKWITLMAEEQTV